MRITLYSEKMFFVMPKIKKRGQQGGIKYPTHLVHWPRDTATGSQWRFYRPRDTAAGSQRVKRGNLKGIC